MTNWKEWAHNNNASYHIRLGNQYLSFLLDDKNDLEILITDDLTPEKVQQKLDWHNMPDPEQY